MSYALQADLVLILHLVYVGFVLLGQIAILIGACLRWLWVRNPWFRWLHLLAMGIVVFEVLVGITCPLSIWERDLRELDDDQNIEAISSSLPNFKRKSERDPDDDQTIVAMSASVVSLAYMPEAGPLVCWTADATDPYVRPPLHPVLRILRKLLFPGTTPAFFIPIYVGFFVIVLTTLILAPPRWPRWRRRGGARFKLTERSLDAWRSAGVPETVLSKLNSLKDKELQQDRFRVELTNVLDQDERERFLSLLLSAAQSDQSPMAS
jgi:Protein of Unknown function (DUF2784)